MPLSPAGAPSLPLLAGPAADPVGEALAAALPLPAGAAPAPAQRAATPAATIDLSPVAVLQHGLETLVAAAEQIGPALAEFARTTAPTPGSLPGSLLAAPPGATPPGPTALRLAAAISLAGTAAQAVGNAIETALPRPVTAPEGVAAGQGAAGEAAQPAPTAGGSAFPDPSRAQPAAALPPSFHSRLQPSPLPDRAEQPEGVPLSPPTTPDGATPPRAVPCLPDTAARRTGPPEPALPSLLLSLLQPSSLPDRTERPEGGPLPLPATPDGVTPPRAGQQPLPRLPDAAEGRTGRPDPARGAIDALSGTDEALQAVRQHLESMPDDRATPATREAAIVQAALLPAEAQLAVAAARLVAILPAAPGLAPLRGRARRAAGAAARRPGLAFWGSQELPSWRELGLLLPLGTAALVAGLLVAADRPLIRASCAAIGLLACTVLVARRCQQLRLAVAAPARRKDG